MPISPNAQFCPRLNDRSLPRYPYSDHRIVSPESNLKASAMLFTPPSEFLIRHTSAEHSLVYSAHFSGTLPETYLTKINDTFTKNFNM